MTLSEDIKKYLPQYLSDDDSKQLFAELKSFPENIDSRFYTNKEIEKDIIYQGDCINKVNIFKIPELFQKKTKGFVISNTCDIDVNNIRIFPTRIQICPFIELDKLRIKLIEKHVEESRVNEYIKNIKSQKISNAFYLPKINEVIEEGVVYFDQSNSYPLQHIDRNKLNDERAFTLSMYGFYIFLIKLSIHYTRIRENVIR